MKEEATSQQKQERENNSKSEACENKFIMEERIGCKQQKCIVKHYTGGKMVNECLP